MDKLGSCTVKVHTNEELNMSPEELALGADGLARRVQRVVRSDGIIVCQGLDRFTETRDKDRGVTIIPGVVGQIGPRSVRSSY